MKNLKLKTAVLLFTVHCSLFTVFGCGYHLIGSSTLPFDSVTVKPVKNKTYEPRLEERLHNALAKEFIAQGINVKTEKGGIEIEATVTAFELNTIAAIDEKIQEQAITMRVDIKITDKGKVTEFTSIESPLKITFQSSGSVSQAVVHKEKAVDKACAEIAKEIIGKTVIKYAKQRP
ncbi:MAG: hypothetical protein HY759_00975 [Nitrospirae bacterium]|nr:hypothetical protein [Nitrospirota bacterium]